MALVAVASAATAAIFITLSFLNLGFLMSVVAAGIIAVAVVVYFVGAAKLTKSLEGRISTVRTARAGTETGLRIVTLTRQVAGVMIVNLLIQGSNAVLGSSNALMPLQIIVVKLLMPIGLSAVLLLLLRFIRGSFNRKMSKREDRTSRRRSNIVPNVAASKNMKSTASVSPAMDFTSTSRAGTTESSSGRPMMMVIQPPGGHTPRSL